MKRILARVLVVVALLFVVAFAAPASAHALDCGDRLVTFGDASAYVRTVCGEPSSITSNFGFTSGAVVYGRGTMRTATVEIWIYDFGPSRFMEELTFVNGILQNDRTLGMGTVYGTAGRREPRRPRRDE